MHVHTGNCFNLRCLPATLSGKTQVARANSPCNRYTLFTGPERACVIAFALLLKAFSRLDPRQCNPELHLNGGKHSVAIFFVALCRLGFRASPGNLCFEFSPPDFHPAKKACDDNASNEVKPGTKSTFHHHSNSVELCLTVGCRKIKRLPIHAAAAYHLMPSSAVFVDSNHCILRGVGGNRNCIINVMNKQRTGSGERHSSCSAVESLMRLGQAEQAIDQHTTRDAYDSLLRLVQTTAVDGGVTSITLDPAGNRTKLIDSGAAANHIVYAPFGQVTYESNTAAVPWTGVGGGHEDPNTGLVNDLHRWYDPATGRWLSQDPDGFLARDANLTRYASNNPLTMADRPGLSSIPYKGWWNPNLQPPSIQIPIPTPPPIFMVPPKNFKPPPPPRRRPLVPPQFNPPPQIASASSYLGAPAVGVSVAAPSSSA